MLEPLVAFFRLSVALAFPQLEIGTDPIPVQIPGCNSVAYAQVPSEIDYFIGRQLNNTDLNDPCSGSTWSLGLYRMHWSNEMKLPQLVFKKKIFEMPFPIEQGKYLITTAYDPTVIRYQNEIWVAFECYGDGFPGSVAACVGPLNTSFELIAERTTVVIFGISACSMDSYLPSASVPKLFVFQNRVYLYWTLVKIKKTDFSWIHITTRGIELERERSGLRRLWAKGVHWGIPSNDSKSVEVWGLESGPTTDRVADMFQVWEQDSILFATAGIGGGDCLNPLSHSPGCYRLALSWAHSPLEERIYNQNRFKNLNFPSNPQEYTRAIVTPDNKVYLMGNFLKGIPKGEDELIPGFFAFPLKISL